jgi:hypothetical protein
MTISTCLPRSVERVFDEFQQRLGSAITAIIGPSKLVSPAPHHRFRDLDDIVP